VTSAEVSSVSERLASTSFRRLLLGKLIVQRWRGSSGYVRLSDLLMSFLLMLSIYFFLAHQSVADCVHDNIPEYFGRRSIIPYLHVHSTVR